MRCPNCGTENVTTAQFCSRCGLALPAAAAGPPAAALPPPPGAGQPVVPGPRRSLSPAVLGAIIGVGVLAVGLVVWAVFLRGDGGGGISGAPSPSTSVGPDAVVASPTVSPPTGPTAATAPTGATGATGTPALSVFIELCQDIDDQLNCVDPVTYANGWSIGPEVTQFAFKLTTENLQPGDVITMRTVDQATGESAGETTWGPIPEEVLDWEAWILTTDPIAKDDPSLPWTPGSFEFTILHNDDPVEFDGPNVYTLE